MPLGLMETDIAAIQRAADAWFEQNRDRFAALEPTEHLKNALRRAGRARAEAELEINAEVPHCEGPESTGEIPQLDRRRGKSFHVTMP